MYFSGAVTVKCCYFLFLGYFPLICKFREGYSEFFKVVVLVVLDTFNLEGKIFFRSFKFNY